MAERELRVMCIQYQLAENFTLSSHMPVSYFSLPLLPPRILSSQINPARCGDDTGESLLWSFYSYNLNTAIDFFYITVHESRNYIIS